MAALLFWGGLVALLVGMSNGDMPTIVGAGISIAAGLYIANNT